MLKKRAGPTSETAAALALSRAGEASFDRVHAALRRAAPAAPRSMSTRTSRCSTRRTR